MFFIWIKFVICSGLIYFAGQRIARYGDIIAEKTGLGGLWIGVVLVAVTTSLPEIFTGVGSVIFVDAPDLTVGNLLGANTYNLLNIAILDFFHKGSPLLSVVSSGQLLTAVLGLIPLSITGIGIFLSLRLPIFNISHISIYSFLIMFSYLICVKIIFKFEENQRILKELREETEKIFKYKEFPLKKAYLFYVIFAVLIVVGGIWLAHIGDELSRNLGLSQSFIGSLLLGFTTTLPEVVVSITAIRLGAKEIAVANMLGSNLFNTSIISINDLLYLKVPIFKVLSENHLFTTFIVIFMTCIVIAGIVLKPENKTKLGLSNYALVLITIFTLGVYINFISGAR